MSDPEVIAKLDAIQRGLVDRDATLRASIRAVGDTVARAVAEIRTDMVALASRVTQNDKDIAELSRLERQSRMTPEEQTTQPRQRRRPSQNTPANGMAVAEWPDVANDGDSTPGELTQGGQHKWTTVHGARVKVPLHTTNEDIRTMVKAALEEKDNAVVLTRVKWVRGKVTTGVGVAIASVATTATIALILGVLRLLGKL